jgi:dihydrofolate reductase
LNCDIKAAVQRVKEERGKDIWLFGGAALTRSLLALHLIDEIALAVHPIILGGGKRLFPQLTKRMELQLLDTKTYSSGLVALTYAPRIKVND